MLLDLPADHVILVLNDKAVIATYGGTHYGFAIGYLPKYEQMRDTPEGREFQQGLAHEVAHYYWRENESWINEGLANTIEYMYGEDNGLSPGELKIRRGDCEAHDLEMLSEWDAPIGNPEEYACNYYLGERLFLELREGLGEAEFSEKLRDLYHLSLTAREARQTAGIATVRQVFNDQAGVVDTHWSGALNAPENRPFDEGADLINHDLIQWDQRPTYDGQEVSFSGTLLDDAVLSKETLSRAREAGPTNFQLILAADNAYVGSILPPPESGWILNDAGDTVATVYQLDERAFTVTFQFPQVPGSPSDYVVLVWGYKDDTRTPTIGANTDPLGKARIRNENNAPQFPDAETGVRSVAENTPAGEHVGAPVAATDADNDVLTYTLSGADMDSFAIDSATGQLLTMDALDFETKASWSFTVTASDGEDESPLLVTVTVTNEDEDGTVELSTEDPRVGTAITATLTDPDGRVTGPTWQWARSSDGSTWTDITEATDTAYAPVAADEGNYLRATASYTDGEGSGKREEAVTANAVVSTSTTDSVIGDRYDADDNGEIDKSEVIQAIKDYLFGEGDAAIDKADVIAVIKLYLFG